jgi:hypothetical protein
MAGLPARFHPYHFGVSIAATVWIRFVEPQGDGGLHLGRSWLFHSPDPNKLPSGDHFALPTRGVTPTISRRDADWKALDMYEDLQQTVGTCGALDRYPQPAAHLEQFEPRGRGTSLVIGSPPPWRRNVAHNTYVKPSRAIDKMLLLISDIWSKILK